MIRYCKPEKADNPNLIVFNSCFEIRRVSAANQSCACGAAGVSKFRPFGDRCPFQHCPPNSCTAERRQFGPRLEPTISLVACTISSNRLVLFGRARLAPEKIESDRAYGHLLKSRPRQKGLKVILEWLNSLGGAVRGATASPQPSDLRRPCLLWQSTRLEIVGPLSAHSRHLARHSL